MINFKSFFRLNEMLKVDGEGKPSDEWVAKVERRIQYFKHRG